MPSSSARWATTLTRKYLRASLASGRTPGDIALEAGCSENTVRDQLARYGLLDIGPIPPALSADYGELGSIELVAKRHDVSFSTARRWLLASGVQLSDAHRPARTGIDIDDAAKRYASGKSLADLAGEFAVGTNTMKRRLEAHGVVLRPRGPRPTGS